MKFLKSRTIRFNMIMSIIDVGVANAALIQDLLTVKEFAITMLTLKVLQSVGNVYYRSITTESLNDK